MLAGLFAHQSLVTHHKVLLDPPVAQDEDTDSVVSYETNEHKTLPVKLASSQAASPRKAAQPTAQERADSCICGDRETDSTMVCCEGCDRWSHMPCTG